MHRFHSYRNTLSPFPPIYLSGFQNQHIHADRLIGAGHFKPLDSGLAEVVVV